MNGIIVHSVSKPITHVKEIEYFSVQNRRQMADIALWKEEEAIALGNKRRTNRQLENKFRERAFI